MRVPRAIAVTGGSPEKAKLLRGIHELSIDMRLLLDSNGNLNKHEATYD
jgi:hypothetical protein